MTIRELIDALTEASSLTDDTTEVYASTESGQRLSIAGLTIGDEGEIRIAVRPYG